MPSDAIQRKLHFSFSRESPYWFFNNLKIEGKRCSAEPTSVSKFKVKAPDANTSRANTANTKRFRTAEDASHATEEIVRPFIESKGKKAKSYRFGQYGLLD